MHRIYPMLGGHASQDGNAALLPNNSLYRQGISGMIDGWIQSAENRLSQMFWQGISSLPESYFPKDINTNYQDKLFWEGLFNEKIEELKEQWGTRQLAPSTVSLNHINDKKTAQLGKLKEQTAAGFLQDDLSLEKQLIHLQGLVGKKTLSPQCYESGLENLKQSLSQSYASVIEKTLIFFQNELKQQPELLAECFQGDVFNLLKRSQALAWTDLQKIVDYYQPLMNRENYIKHQNWVKSCYSEQSLLPPPLINKPIHQEKTLTVKKRESRYGYSIGNMSKFLWEHAGKLVTLGLAAQVAAVQAAGSGKTFNLKYVEDKLRFPCDNSVEFIACVEDFIINLGNVSKQIQSNDNLYNTQVLPLSSRIKSIMELDNYFDISDYHRCKLIDLKNNIPLSVNNLIWKGNDCNIKNIYWNEYLYTASDYFNYDSDRRRVFTWRHKGEKISQGYWAIKSLNDDGIHFQIKNTYHNEYLYAASAYFDYDSDRRRVFAWIGGAPVQRSKGIWILKLTDKSSNSFEIINVEYKEHLYAADYATFDSERRRVFTWKVGVKNGYSAWKIDC